MKRIFLIGALFLPACNPQSIADNVTGRAARSVIVNVVVNQYPRPQAEVASDCIFANASPAETEALARDVGTRAGTVTVANIRTIGNRPATMQCLTGHGLLPLAIR